MLSKVLLLAFSSRVLLKFNLTRRLGLNVECKNLQPDSIYFKLFS